MGASMDRARDLFDSIRQSPLSQQPEFARALVPVQEQLPDFGRMISTLVAAPEVKLAQIDRPMAAANQLDQESSQLGQLSRTQAHVEHQRLADRFRRQVLIISIIFLLAINFSIVLLLRAASMILRPVDKLVQAAHGLGREHFETRVDIDDNTEFSQLAQAYNGMAEQLQTSEKRKMEVLGQVEVGRSCYHSRRGEGQKGGREFVPPR